jgi:rhodanese-related sulfurtransferase
MTIAIVVIVAIALLFLASKAGSLGLPKGSVVQAAEAKAWMSAHPGFQLVDVRSKVEHGQARIPGSLHIPLDELASRSSELDKGKPVLLYCAAGGRSSMALRQLRKEGFGQACHLAGGISAWSQAGNTVAR